jgi:anion-transporting  ArsA/GET3 family ATPase
MTLLRSPETVVHLVTVLEEMPVQETADAVAELRAAGLPVGGVVVNQVRTPFLTSGQLPAARNGGLDRQQVLAGLSAGGLGRRSRRSGNDTSPKALADALLAEASEHSLRLGVEHQERLEIARLERPTYLLPFVPNGIDLGALYLLANRLGTRGGG